jgi:hypothetical protein
MTRLDSTGLHALHELQLQMRAAGIELRLATMRWPLREVVARADLAGELLEGVTHGSIGEALRALGLPADHPLCAPSAEEPTPEVWF